VANSVSEALRLASPRPEEGHQPRTPPEHDPGPSFPTARGLDDRALRRRRAALQRITATTDRSSRAGETRGDRSSRLARQVEGCAGLMRGFVAPTDHDWYQFLRARPELGEVNFWRPGAANFKALQPGEPFFFKLKAPYNAIGGFGLFARFARLPAWRAWDVFGDSQLHSRPARPAGAARSPRQRPEHRARSEPHDRLRRRQRNDVLRARRVGGDHCRLGLGDRRGPQLRSSARRGQTALARMPRARGNPTPATGVGRGRPDEAAHGTARRHPTPAGPGQLPARRARRLRSQMRRHNRAFAASAPSSPHSPVGGRRWTRNPERRCASTRPAPPVRPRL
jgi:hypothetical protein